jgi:site-specific recombinase XerD
MPHLAGVISYTMRHSFATQALVNGVGIAHVAELMGHVDTSMVSQHYAIWRATCSTCARRP